MADVNEIGGQPQEQGDNQRPKGIRIFMSEKNAAYLARMGRQLTETILNESFILYRVDMKRTEPNFYGESKKKVYKDPVELWGRIGIESEPVGYQTVGGIMKRNVGTMTAHVYLDHIEEKGLLIKKDGQHIQLDLKVGDFIMFKGQYFVITDDGFSQLDNEFSFGGDRRFAITIKAVEVDEDRFKAR